MSVSGPRYALVDGEWHRIAPGGRTTGCGLRLWPDTRTKPGLDPDDTTCGCAGRAKETP